MQLEITALNELSRTQKGKYHGFSPFGVQILYEYVKLYVSRGLESRSQTGWGREGIPGGSWAGGCLDVEEYAQSASYTFMKQSYVAHYSKNFKDLKTKNGARPK